MIFIVNFIKEKETLNTKDNKDNNLMHWIAMIKPFEDYKKEKFIRKYQISNKEN